MKDDDFMAINKRKTLTSRSEEQTKLDTADYAFCIQADYIRSRKIRTSVHFLIGSGM